MTMITDTFKVSITWDCNEARSGIVVLPTSPRPKDDVDAAWRLPLESGDAAKSFHGESVDRWGRRRGLTVEPENCKKLEELLKPNFRSFDLNNVDHQWLASHLGF